MRVLNRAQTAWHREERLCQELDALCLRAVPDQAPSQEGTSCASGRASAEAGPAEAGSAADRPTAGQLLPASSTPHAEPLSAPAMPPCSQGRAEAEEALREARPPRLCVPAYRRLLFRQIVLRTHPDKGRKKAESVALYRRAVDAKAHEDTLHLMIIARTLSVDLRLHEHFHHVADVQPLERRCAEREHRVAFLQRLLRNVQNATCRD